MSALQWGIVSTANIGRAAVIPAIHQSASGVVLAVASREYDRARKFAEANAIPNALGSYEALLEDEGIDAVYIPLPNSMHAEWTIRFAEAGKHVLCEKPLGVTAAECNANGRCRGCGGRRLHGSLHVPVSPAH